MIFGFIFRAVAFEFREQSRAEVLLEYRFWYWKFRCRVGARVCTGERDFRNFGRSGGSLYRYNLGLAELEVNFSRFDVDSGLCLDWLYLPDSKNIRRVATQSL